MTLLVVYRVLPVEESNKSASASHFICGEEVGSCLPWHEAAKEHTSEINKGRMEYFMVHEPLRRGLISEMRATDWKRP